MASYHAMSTGVRHLREAAAMVTPHALSEEPHKTHRVTTVVNRKSAMLFANSRTILQRAPAVGKTIYAIINIFIMQAHFAAARRPRGDRR